MKSYGIAIIAIILLLSTPVLADQIKVGDGSFAVASGDMVQLSGYANGSSTAWMWLFTFQSDMSIYGSPIAISGGNFQTSVINITKLPVGTYPMVIEFGGKNGIQEVLYDNVSKSFISPWRAPLSEESSENPYERIHQIEIYCNVNKPYCDDSFYATNVTIERPFIRFTDMYAYSYSDIDQSGKSSIKDITKNGLLYLGGETNMDSKTQITVILDHNQTVKAVTEQVDPNGYYRWSAFLDISKLRTGSHPILIKSPKTDDLQTFLEIGLEPVPTPTPKPMIKVVRNEFVSSAGNTVAGPSAEITTKVTTAPSNQFVSVTPPVPVAVPTVVNIISDNDPLPVVSTDIIIVEPTKSKKLPSNPLYIIIGVILSIFIIKRVRKVK
jgi:hypothetical protein